MNDITDLQSRITTALDRIGIGLDALVKAPEEGAESDEVIALRAALEDERTANAQLEARVLAIKEKQDGTVRTLSREVDRLRGLLEAEEAAIARLTRVNAELRANNAALREAIAEGVAEPHLVNKAMMAELDALRATQGADRTEIDAVLGEVSRLVDEITNRPAEQEGESADA
jgi:uncharacterized protein (DUF885 family)